MSQRRFAVMGDNIFQIAKRLSRDQSICRLLHYTDRNPLSKEHPDIKGTELLHKNILVVPKPPDSLITKENFIVVLFDNFVIDGYNKDFKISTVRFNIICPFDEPKLITAIKTYIDTSVIILNIIFTFPKSSSLLTVEARQHAIIE